MSDRSNKKLAALVGAPNSGKTTLYNWMTRSKYKVVNYPGSTVEIARGVSFENPDLGLIDTPGTYSLSPKSSDEEITLKTLAHPEATHLVLVVDATQLARNWALIHQAQQTGLSFILVLTMVDLLTNLGRNLDLVKLEKILGASVFVFNGVNGLGLNEILGALKETASGQMKSSSKNLNFALEPEQLKDLLTEGRRVESELTVATPTSPKNTVLSVTRKLDRVLLHPFLGLIVFAVLMTSLFTMIFWAAAPAMDAIENSLAFLSGQILAVAPNSLWVQFISEGLVTSLASLLVFTPQIFILFFGLGILEASGYLARASTLIDRPFSMLGLSGRSFVPLLGGFACAVPAMMATRNLSSARDRWITNAIIPLMTCSARLPVYALLLGLLFIDQPAWKAGLGMAALYIGSLVVGAVAAAILNSILAKKMSSKLVMDLPVYRKPRLKTLVSQSFKRTKSYVTKAGPTIFAIAVLIWFGTNFPRVEIPNLGLQKPELSDSYLGQLGQWMNPVFKPMGADWRIGVGLISAFAAREVFVSTLAVIFKVTDEEGSGLTEALRAAQFEGHALFTTASIVAVLVFFMIALQCMATFAVAIKESGSAKFAWGQLIIFNLAGYVLAVLCFQSLQILGHT